MWDKGINGRAPEGGDFTKRSQACYTLSNSEWEKGGILFLQPRYQTGKAIDRECAGGEMLSGARSNHRLPCILLPGCGGRQTTTRRRREKIKKRIPELVPAPGCVFLSSHACGVLLFVCPHSRGAVCREAGDSNAPRIAFLLPRIPGLSPCLSGTLAVKIRYHLFPIQSWIKYNRPVNVL